MNQNIVYAGKSHISSLTIVAIVAPIIVSVVLFFMGYCFLIRRKASKTVQEENAANEISIVESLQFDFATIEAATNKFSDDKKLGEGGFGQVYKVHDIDRPTMVSIVLMLNSYSITLPSPQNPAYFRIEQNMPLVGLKLDKSGSKSIPSSVNEASITEVYPR
ncbi:cysteine-rich receptor-like protein kinase 15 [Quercus suber]|uniref:Cysteine-rich receptor-like protein kinase 15 n=1 Tax=Quercus suber TaxID=58331 RepID=A0AAW0JHT3_QUESU